MMLRDVFDIYNSISRHPFYIHGGIRVTCAESIIGDEDKHTTIVEFLGPKQGSHGCRLKCQAHRFSLRRRNINGFTNSQSIEN